MTNYLTKLFSIALLAAITISCAEDVTENTGGPSIDSFDVQVNNTTYKGTINSETDEISIWGLSSGNTITAFDYSTANGTNLYPSPNSFLKNWSDESITITAQKNGVKREYTIKLENYIAPDITNVPTDEDIAETRGQNIYEISTDNLAHSRNQLLFIGFDIERSFTHLAIMNNAQGVASWVMDDINWSVCRVAYDKNQEAGCDDYVQTTKNPSFYDTTITSMKIMRDKNPHIEFCSTLRSDYHGYGQGNTNNVPNWIYNIDTKTWEDETCVDYANFLVDFLEIMADNGLDFTYFATGKEWQGVITAARAIKTIQEMEKECERRGLAFPLFMEPGAWALSQVENFHAATVTAGAENLFYAFCTHNYNPTQTGYSWYTANDNVGTTGHALFATETSYGHGGPTSGVEQTDFSLMVEEYRRKYDIYTAGTRGEMFFEPMSRGQASETRAIYRNNTTLYSHRMRSYYPMKEFTNALVPRNTMRNMDYPAPADEPQYPRNPDNKFFVETKTTIDEREVKHMGYGATAETTASASDLINAMSFMHKDKNDLSVIILNESNEPVYNNIVVCDDMKTGEKYTVSIRMFDIYGPFEGTLTETHGITAEELASGYDVGHMPLESMLIVRITAQ